MSKLPPHISYLLGLIVVAIMAGIATALILLAGCSTTTYDFERYQTAYLRDAGWSEMSPGYWHKTTGKVHVSAWRTNREWTMCGDVYGYMDTCIQTGAIDAFGLVIEAEKYIAQNDPYVWTEAGRLAQKRERHGPSAER